eukprot:TRINITY_DN197_c4_g1_i1.p1 TRINITY_DN197_c4_g1~~TRINITY_DN197_c4_g1_i1.p1  ORF type:complete len:529 (+),score=214.29 TRINITY_DN197_c4_g1_i1:31-1617(+)
MDQRRRISIFGRMIRRGISLVLKNQKHIIKNKYNSFSNIINFYYSKKMAEEYDLIVLGAGSGGMASARRAAEYGAKVAVVENSRLGGTCVNVGCVPKKVMFNTCRIAEAFHHAKEYGYTFDNQEFNWNYVKTKRDAYIKRLNGVYQNKIDSTGVTLYRGRGSFVDVNTIKVNDTTIKGRYSLIATGGHPVFPRNTPGAEEYGLTSDDFFDFEELPKKIAIVGAGYIAVELAGILATLGSDVTLIIRNDKALRSFDDMLSDYLMVNLEKLMTVQKNSTIKEVIKVDGNNENNNNNNDDKPTYNLTFVDSDTVLTGFEHVLFAIGRRPNTDIGLEAAGIELNDKGYIKVNKYQETSQKNCFALGDVCGNYELTPVAINAGRKLVHNLFNNPENNPWLYLEYENIPTVVFSHPPIGTIGMTVDQAREKYDLVKVWTAKFNDTYFSIFENADNKVQTQMRLITAGDNDKVVGLHVIGMGSDEMIQGFGAAIRMGATKADLDNVVAIHPTASEEFVTLAVKPGKVYSKSVNNN